MFSDCSRFWSCGPSMETCLFECERCWDNPMWCNGQWAKTFDPKFQGIYGPVCEWPVHLDCNMPPNRTYPALEIINWNLQFINIFFKWIYFKSALIKEGLKNTLLLFICQAPLLFHTGWPPEVANLRRQGVQCLVSYLSHSIYIIILFIESLKEKLWAKAFP